jgi:hypothetical protein
MATFIVEETICYEVEADSAEEAEEIIVNSDHEQILKYPQWVEERTAYER